MRFLDTVDCLKASRRQVESHLRSIPPNKNGLATRHAACRALKTFFRWLSAEYGLKNPMEGITAPILGKPIMPTLSREQVEALLQGVESVRDRAIIAQAVVGVVVETRGSCTRKGPKGRQA